MNVDMKSQGVCLTNSFTSEILKLIKAPCGAFLYFKSKYFHCGLYCGNCMN